MEVDEENMVTIDDGIVCEWNGFSIIGDNWHKNIKPSFAKKHHFPQ